MNETAYKGPRDPINAPCNQPVETVFTHGTDAEEKIPRLSEQQEWRVSRLQAIVTHGGYEELSQTIVAALAKAHQDGWYEGRNYEIKLAKEGK